jgi:hypothetical protein
MSDEPEPDRAYRYRQLTYPDGYVEQEYEQLDREDVLKVLYEQLDPGVWNTRDGEGNCADCQQPERLYEFGAVLLCIRCRRRRSRVAKTLDEEAA